MFSVCPRRGAAFTGILPSMLFSMVLSLSGLLRAVLHYISPLTVAVNSGIVGLSIHSSRVRCVRTFRLHRCSGFGASPIPSLKSPHFKMKEFKGSFTAEEDCRGVLQPAASQQHSVLPGPCGSFSKSLSC